MSGKKLFFIQLIFAFFFTSFSYSVTEKEAVAQAEKNIEKAVSLLEMDKGWFKKENYSAAKAAVFEIKNNAQILWDFSLQDNGQNPGSTNESENMVYVCEDAVKFRALFKQTFTHVMTSGFAVEQSKIALLK